MTLTLCYSAQAASDRIQIRGSLEAEVRTISNVDLMHRGHAPSLSTNHGHCRPLRRVIALGSVYKPASIPHIGDWYISTPISGPFFQVSWGPHCSNSFDTGFTY